MGLVVILFALAGFGTGSAVYEARAREHEARADSLSRVVAAQAERNARLTEAVNTLDSLYSAASIQWALERRDLTAQITRARQDGARSLDDLRAHVDSTGVALLAEHEASDAEAWAADAQVHEGYEAQLAAADERDAAKDSLIAGLRAEIAPLKAENAELRQANDLLHAQIGSMKRTSWLWKAAAAGEAAVILVDAVRGS